MTIKNGATALTGSACLNKPELAFREAMQHFFGPLDLIPIGDDEFHRFHVSGDRPGTRNGWYVLHLKDIATGFYGTWKVSGSNIWKDREPANSLEARLIAQRVQRAREQRDSEQARRQLETARKANCTWSKAKMADSDHPYLVQKQVSARGLRQSGDTLLVPLYADDCLCNLQRVGPDGVKRFLYGGRVIGAYSLIGSLKSGQPIYICEGWATGATIHAETGAPVVCAMNAGNLLAVGRQLQQQYPYSPLIIAGDDDRKTEGNPGRTAANKAAAALGCSLVFPPFPDGAPVELSDFNDLAIWRATQ